MQASRVRHYLERASDFFQGMQLTRDDLDYRNSAALLAIHCAISFSDALRAGLGDQQLAADDHRSAVASLRRLLPSGALQAEAALRHLEFLLKRKSVVTYGDKMLDHTDFAGIFTKSARFAQWADSTGHRLNIEGWIHGDQ